MKIGRLIPAAITGLLLLSATVGAAQESVTDATAAVAHARQVRSERDVPSTSTAPRGVDSHPGAPVSIAQTISVDDITSVSGSTSFRSATGPYGGNAITLDAPGDFRTGQYVEIDHAGLPCNLWSVGACASLEDIIPTITVQGAPGSTRYCVQISVLDSNGGVSRPLNLPGGTCIRYAPEVLDSTNYVKIRYYRARKNGRTAAGDLAYVFWVSTNGPSGPWIKRGVMNEPTAGIDPVLDDMGGTKLVYDPDLVPLLNTTEPSTPDPSDYWWVPNSPTAGDLNDWLFSSISGGGGSSTLTLADSISNSQGVSGQRINHDDGPPIQAVFNGLRPNTEVVFGPHHYRIFKLMFGNGATALSLIAIGDDPANDSGTVLAGAGMDQTFIEGIPCYNAGDGIRIGGSSTHHVKNVVVRDLTVDNHACGFLPNGPTSAALETSNADNVTIERVRATNGATATVWVAEGVNNYYFDSSEAEGGWGDVFHGSCQRGQCPRNLWVTNSTFPYGGADGGFGVLSESSTSSPRGVHVVRNFFGCGAGFQGCTNCDFLNNHVSINNPHLLTAGLFAPDATYLSGNSNLDIGFNLFDKKQEFGHYRTDVFGNPPSILQIGNANFARNPRQHQGRPIKVHDNTIKGTETYGIFLCADQVRLSNDQTSGFAGRQGLYVCSFLSQARGKR